MLERVAWRRLVGCGELQRLARAISVSFDGGGGGVGASSDGAGGGPFFTVRSVASGEPRAAIHAVKRTATTTRVGTRRFYTWGDARAVVAVARSTRMFDDR